MDASSFLGRGWQELINLNDSGKIIAVSLVLLFSVYYVLFGRDKRKLPPGPIGLPLLGYWPFVVNNSHKNLNKLAKKYGNVFSLYLGQTYTVVCNDWPAVKDALSKTETLNKPIGLFEVIPLGIGFSSRNGKEWSEQRRFTVKTMKDIGLGRPQWEELVQQEVDETVARIQSSVGRSIDISDMFTSTFTSNILTMLFGHRLPYDDPEVKRVSENIDIVLQQNASLGLENFLPYLSAWLMRIGLYGSMEAIQKVRDFSEFVQKCIEKRLQSEEMDDQESYVKTYFQEVENNKMNNLNNTFTDLSMRGNTQGLVLGGSETTKSSFLWLLVAVAQFPEKQDRVHQELDMVLGRNGTIKWSDRTKVPYTFATIMESMRWKTLVPINSLRMTSEDTTIVGYDVPKGTVILSNLWALHNDPRYWPDPEKFEPERFLVNGGNSVNFKPDSYIPFSFGKRNCPGEIVAMTEILQYFTAIMQKFKVLPQEGDTTVKFKAHHGLTYQPWDVKLRFLPRE